MYKNNTLISSLLQKKNAEGHFVVDDVYCKYHLANIKKPIVITFDALQEGGDPTIRYKKIDNATYMPWGFKYIKILGFNVISFAPKRESHWYRNPIFHSFIKELGKALEDYPKVIGVGSSMGAYAVSAFADELHISNLLLMAPVSTLNEELVQFDKRFEKYKKYNWRDSYHDAAETKSKGYVIYDPLSHQDSKHAYRYKNMQYLKLFGVGHFIPIHLNKLDMLKIVMGSFLIYGRINKEDFYTLSRERRKYRPYYEWMCSEKNIHLTPKRKEIIEKFRKNL